MRFIALKNSSGQLVHVNPDCIALLRQPVLNEYELGAVRCVIHMTSGREIGVSNTILDVMALI